VTDTGRRRLRFWTFPWIGAWLAIGGTITSGLWTAHPIAGWIVGAAAGYFIGVSTMFFMERWWGIRAHKSGISGRGPHMPVKNEEIERWEEFRGMANTELVLRRKAFIISKLIDDVLDEVSSWQKMSK